jgi:hypothetical protein
MARNDTTEASQCTLGGFPEYVVNVTVLLKYNSLSTSLAT